LKRKITKTGEKSNLIVGKMRLTTFLAGAKTGSVTWINKKCNGCVGYATTQVNTTLIITRKL